jgi:FkbM family methyltransferase
MAHDYLSHGYRVYEEKQDNSSLLYIDTISAISIEDLMPESNVSAVDILKIDIVGAEYELCAGDTGWLSKVRVMVIETHDDSKKTQPK